MSDKDFMPIYKWVREVYNQHRYRKITRRDNGDVAKINHKQMEITHSFFQYCGYNCQCLLY